MGKSDCFSMKRKILLCPDFGKRSFFDPKSTLELFSQFNGYIFLKLPTKGFQKWVRMAVFDFERRFILCSKCAKWFNCWNWGSTVTSYLLTVFLGNPQEMMINSSKRSKSQEVFCLFSCPKLMFIAFPSMLVNL